MLSWILCLILLAAAGAMAFGPSNFNVAPILWCASWGMMLLLFLIFGGGYLYSFEIYIYVFGCILTWLAGHFLMAWVYRYAHQGSGLGQTERYSYRYTHLREFLLLCAGLGMLAPVSFAAHTGLHLSQITDLSSLMSTAQNTHALMSENLIETDFISKICLMFALCGVLMSGIHLGLDSPGVTLKPYLMYSSFLPYFVMMLLTTMRSLIVLPLLVLFVGYIAGRALRNKDRSIFKSKLLIRIVGGVVALFITILLMQSIRAGDYKFQRLGDSLEHLRLWFAGYFPAFVSWIKTEWDGTHQMGKVSFRLFASLLGFSVNAVQYGDGMVYVGNGEIGNAKTCLYHLVADFGMKGAVIALFVWGGINGWVSEAVRAGKLIFAPLLALLFAMAIWAPNSWFFGYGARILSPVVIISYLYFFSSTSVKTVKRGARLKRSRGVRQTDGDNFSSSLT